MPNKEQERKRSMKKKKWIVVLLGVVLIIVVCVGVRFIKGSSAEISLKENQRYVYAYITSIQGNEVTYMEMEESVVTAMLEPETETDKPMTRKMRTKILRKNLVICQT